MNPKLEFLTLSGFKDLIKFAKEQGIPKLKAGAFECDLPSKDLNQVKLDALEKRIFALESVCQRLALQVEAKVRDTHRPFSARVDLQRKDPAA